MLSAFWGIMAAIQVLLASLSYMFDKPWQFTMAVAAVFALFQIANKE